MKSPIIYSTIQLMENNEVIYTITIDNVESYDFSFDSKGKINLNLTATEINMNDLNLLVTKQYESYVVMGRKRLFKNNLEQFYEIPAIVFNHLIITDNGDRIRIFFDESK